MLKPFVELDVPDLSVIQTKFLSMIGGELESGKKGRVFLDTKKILLGIPELTNFFKNYKLYPYEVSATILYDDLVRHIDTLPVAAKINIPIINTTGWVNRWYHTDPTELSSCPIITDRFGFKKEDVSVLDNIPVLAELYDQPKPIVFNSRIIHSVNKLSPNLTPRVVASITFINQPIELLK